MACALSLIIIHCIQFYIPPSLAPLPTPTSVFALFAWTSVAALILALSADGIIKNFSEFYLKEVKTFNRDKDFVTHKRGNEFPMNIFPL